MANIDSVKFKSNNGVVLRTVARLFSNKWFKGAELQLALQAYNLDSNEICTCLDYFTDREYIKSRAVEGKGEAFISDCNLEELEFKLAADGRLVIMSYKQDAGIEV